MPPQIIVPDSLNQSLFNLQVNQQMKPYILLLRLLKKHCELIQVRNNGNPLLRHPFRILL